MSAGTIVRPSRAPVLTAPRIDGTAVIFVVVCAAQFAFGVWMSSRGLRWGDAFYRSTSALFDVHGASGALSRRSRRATVACIARSRALPVSERWQ